MTALILNSGEGKRMGEFTENNPKCLVNISSEDTILSLQLKNLIACGIRNVIITTGPFEDNLKAYCMSLDLPISYKFVHNPLYRETNYIYSIYLAREDLYDNIIMLHGDLVFDSEILSSMLKQGYSQMAISTSMPLPEKDFKAIIEDGRIVKIGVDCYENAVAAQPLYVLYGEVWEAWLSRIISFCEGGRTTCYAENAFNEISGDCIIRPWDYEKRLCAEIDTPEDLQNLMGFFVSGECNPLKRSI
ncbi:MAG: NTP transferase domain-containing protein [Dehalococcoidales bacterium]